MKILKFQLASEAEQAGLNFTLSYISKSRFSHETIHLVLRLQSYMYQHKICLSKIEQCVSLKEILTHSSSSLLCEPVHDKTNKMMCAQRRLR